MNEIEGSFDLLDLKRIKIMLNPVLSSRLSKLEVFNSIDSTNTYLLTQTKKNPVSGWICFAEEQTQGRGRRGRIWYSPLGTNIYCSLLWKFSDPDQNVSSLSLAVAVIIANVLEKLGISKGISLKWPNDILYQGRKLGGILLERSGLFIVIGIGLNVYLPKEIALEKKWADICEAKGEKIERNELAALLVNELLEKLPVFFTHGLEMFLEDWKKFDALLGSEIFVHTSENVFSGVMRGINNRGELLLYDESAGVLREFCYGEVTVRAIGVSE